MSEINERMKALSFIAKALEEYEPTSRRIYSLLANKKKEMRRSLLQCFAEDGPSLRELNTRSGSTNLLFSWETDYSSLIPKVSVAASSFDLSVFLSFVEQILDEASPSRKKLNYLISAEKPKIREALSIYFVANEEYLTTSKPEEKDGNFFHLQVDYGRSPGELAAKAGFYLLDRGLSVRHFRLPSVKETLPLKLELFPYQGKLSAAKEEAEKQGLSLAGLPEILSFAAKYPNEQRQRQIVELRDVWKRRTGDYYFRLNTIRQRRRGQIVGEFEEITGAILLLA